MKTVSSLFLLAATGSADNAANKVTPVEKVMELMKKLSAQVTAEGKKEAEQYDKFACFCKEQADEKLYLIEKSEAIIAKQSAKIQKLSGEIADLNGEINELTSFIAQKEGQIKAAEDLRATQHEAYKKVDADMQAAIDAIVGAIKALKDSKKDVKGDAKLDLLQIQALAMSLTGDHAAKATAALQKLDGPHAYEYQSNDIIAVLENLKDQFLENKKELDEDEFDTNAAFERKKLGLVNEAKFATKDKKEKTATMEAKTEELEDTKEARDEETNAMNADQRFLDTLTAECQQKATDWDQRSRTRSGELKALSEALTALESGAADQYAANKKLNLIQKSVSFLQLRGTSNEALKVAATMKVENLLAKQARNLQSPVLSVMSMKVKLSADHFVKVRGLIKDLIQRLEANALAEAGTKSFCDENMAEATARRDKANAEIEVAVATISKLTNEKAQLESDIQDLKQAIADNLKALNEATELRESEKEENTATIETAAEGQAAVELALSILNQFYENAFIQTGYVPPNSDREGLTVADRAPEVFSGDYHGNQDASKGIIGLLDVILSDFVRTKTTTEQEEKTAQGAFEVFDKDVKDDNAGKETEIKTKEARVASVEDELVEQGEDKESAQKLLQNAKNELKKLKPMCVEGEETYAQRVAKREKEIAALKEAMVILDEWQK